MGRLFLALLLLLPTASWAADTIIKPSGLKPHLGGQLYIDLGSGERVPATVVLGTDGNGNLVPMGPGASAATPVVVASPLPAGNNNIGDVDVVSLPPAALTSFSRSDTYAAVASGVAVNASAAPPQHYSIQVKSTTAVATSWDVRLECSLNNIDFTQVVQHTNTDGDGLVKTHTTPFPCLYFRSRTAALALGTATNIVVTVLGVQ